MTLSHLSHKKSPGKRGFLGVELRREFSNSGPSVKSLVKRLLSWVGKGRKVAPEAPVTVFEDARGPNVRELRQAQRRLPPVELAGLIVAYEAGARVCELAEVYDLHRTTVARHVARAGKTRPVMTEAQIDEAVVLYRDGWTLHNLGQHLGVADQTVRRVLVERDVAIRAGGRRKGAAVPGSVLGGSEKHVVADRGGIVKRFDRGLRQIAS
jgi:hypothetical protein